MNKLKMSLALIALMIPLLLCAKMKRVEMNKRHCDHRSPIELSVSAEVFIDDCNKELIIEFSQDWDPVTIEIKSKEGYVVYRNFYAPCSNSTLSVSLENIPAGIYELIIFDEKVELMGEFVYER